MRNKLPCEGSDNVLSPSPLNGSSQGTIHLSKKELFTMLLMKCDDKITYYNASLAPGPHMHADCVTRMA